MPEVALRGRRPHAEETLDPGVRVTSLKGTEVEPLAQRVADMSPEEIGNPPEPEVTFAIVASVESVDLWVGVEVPHALDINTDLPSLGQVLSVV